MKLKTVPAKSQSLLQDEASLMRAKRTFEEQRRCGQSTGNYMLTTGAGFRLAAANYDAQEVHDYLLNEMGIKVDVTKDENGLQLLFGRFNHHSHATVLRELQGAFRVVSLMHEDGRQALRVLGFAGFPVGTPITIHAK